MTTLTCFRAYDTRGLLGRELNEAIVCRRARAFAARPPLRTVVPGGAARETAPALRARVLRAPTEGALA